MYALEAAATQPLLAGIAWEALGLHHHATKQSLMACAAFASAAGHFTRLGMLRKSAMLRQQNAISARNSLSHRLLAASSLQRIGRPVALLTGLSLQRIQRQTTTLAIDVDRYR